ncbi:MAG: YkgJ family cysteine cluster protein [Promethearchaeota archaeon]|nr:MAG: YkgJ family cysteine cluster protein [Candidatus Lokiarchaeota archaeon]
MVNDGNFCSKHCTGYCCASYTVLITTEDILRILQNTPLKPHQFLCLYEATDDALQYFSKIMINSEEVVIGLKNRDDNSCIFFLKDLGLCGMHYFKPMVCHTYPFTINEKGKLARIENICPNEWYPNDRTEMKRIIHQAWREMKISEKKIKNWNQNRLAGNFYEFIRYISNGSLNKKKQL